MKKVFVILILTIAVSEKHINAQTYGVPDTLTYLQSIVANKSQFIGRPFSVLMDSLKIQIKFFSPFGAIHYNKNKETSTSFSFYFPQTVDEMYLTYPKLEIYWQPYLNAIQSDALWENNNGGGWSSAVKAFYANGIIKDIQVRD